jgi:NAD(P)-dependent dehydrogenase (short-subunit alcohol dehydrogenase family)
VIETIGFDLATSAGCVAMVDSCHRRWGRIDILINNAAITGPPALASFLDSDDGHLDAVIDLNLKGAFRCSREAARHMVHGEGGVIVNIASVGAHAAQSNAAAYVAAKAGLVGLTRALAFDLAPRGVRVVCVSPGDIALQPGPAPPGDEWARVTPLMRRGTPRDVADAVAFLCSEQASFITGSELIVDGGWLTY